MPTMQQITFEKISSDHIIFIESQLNSYIIMMLETFDVLLAEQLEAGLVLLGTS